MPFRKLKTIPQRSSRATVGERDGLTNPDLLKLIATQTQAIENQMGEEKVGSSYAQTEAARAFAPITDVLLKSAETLEKIQTNQLTQMIADNVVPESLLTDLRDQPLTEADTLAAVGSSSSAQASSSQASSSQSTPYGSSSSTPTQSPAKQVRNPLSVLSLPITIPAQTRNTMTLSKIAASRSSPAIFNISDVPVTFSPNPSDPNGNAIIEVGMVSYPLTDNLLQLLISNDKTKLEQIASKDTDVLRKFAEIILEANSIRATTPGYSFPQQSRYVPSNSKWLQNAKSDKFKILYPFFKQDPQIGAGLFGYKQVKSASSHVVGNQLGSEHTVDTALLGKGILHVYDPQGQTVLRTPITSGLHHLLTTRNTKLKDAGKKFSEADLEAYHQVAGMLKMKVDSNNRRRKLMRPEGRLQFLTNDPKQLVERMQVLLGEIESGNNNRDVVNEAMAISDLMLKERLISKRDHQRTFNEIMSAVSST